MSAAGESSTPGDGGALASGGQSRGGQSSGGGSSEDPTKIAGTSGYDCEPPSGAEPALGLEPYLDDLELPVFVTHAPHTEKLYVVELTGQIIEYDPLTDERRLFLELGDKVEVGGEDGDERGFLGLAFHPEFAKNGLIYLHYSAGEAFEGQLERGDTVLEEYHVHDDVVDLDSARLVLSVPQPANNHNGGTVAFGLDRLLYLGLGDGGGAGDPYRNGQNPESLLAKLVRIDPRQTDDAPYAIPPGNLSEKVAYAAPEVWDMGLRNPFRFSFDGCTGDLYIGDVGQDQEEEVNIELPGQGRHNYGWNAMEGLTCYESDSCDAAAFTAPKLTYDHEGANAAITGGSVYRGREIPALRGAYFYADSSSNRVWATRFDRSAEEVSIPVSYTQDLGAPAIVAIQNDARGELLFVSLEGGVVYKLTAF